MAKLAIISALALAAASTASAASAPRYIAKLKSGASLTNVKAEVQAIAQSFNAKLRESDDAVFSKVDKEIDISDKFRAIEGTFSAEMLAELKARDDIEYVEEHKDMHIFGTQTNPPSWGLSRVSQRDLSLPAAYNFPDTAGRGVTVYVIDTGIKVDHADLAGRAKWGATLCPGCPDTDDNGHGTHVAGTIGGTTSGVAKNAEIVAIKVCNAQGSCPSVMQGIEWVSKNGKPGSVVSMSLGGGKSQAQNDAVNAVIAKGFTFAIAAGNSAADACNTSPCSADQSICVGSTDKTDTLSSFSNWGKCVAILAPGSAIYSSWNDGKFNTISGTSMATPHVAGAAALVLADNPSFTPAQVKAKLLEIATKDKIKNVRGSPNLLLNNGFGGDTPKPTTTVAPPTTTIVPTSTVSPPTPTSTPPPPPPPPVCSWWRRFLGLC